MSQPTGTVPPPSCRQPTGTLGWCLPRPPPRRLLAAGSPLLTLGCARNEVDSEELAARLHADGWQVSTDGEGADVVLVNTCGFVEKAKQDSIQTLLAAADTGAKVVAAGCMAERYGRELADSLPEAAGGARLRRLPGHRRPAGRRSSPASGSPSHAPRDRRQLLPLTPVPGAQRRGVPRPR